MSPISDTRMRSITVIVRELLGRWALACFRHGFAALALLSVLGAVAAAGISRLKLDPDITQLLPPTYQSVKDVEALRDRFGGIGYVALIVRGGTPEARRTFADRVTPELERLPEVRYANARVPVEFFKDRGLYFLEDQKLESMRDRLEARQRYQIERGYLDLDDEAPPSIDFSDLWQEQETRLRRMAGPSAGTSEQTSGYYEDASNLVILVRPNEFASNLEFCRRVVAQVENVVARVQPRQFAPDLRVDLSGRYKKRVDLQTALGNDLAWTSTLALLLVLGYVALHFRRVWAVVLVMAPLLVGMAFAYGFAGLGFGTLNVLTAFIGAILLGIGIDNGIHLLGRYQEARLGGLSPERAVVEAFAEAGHVSVAAALTTSAAFGCLAVSDFRAFREFGVLAAAGMFLVLFSYVTLLPALLGLAVRYLPQAAAARKTWTLPGVHWGIRFAPGVVLCLGLASVALFAKAPSIHFNADLSALDRADAESFRLDWTVNHLLGRSQTPLVLLAKDELEAREAADALRSQMAALGQRATIGLVATLHDLVPENQAAKRAILERIRRVLSRVDRSRLTPQERERVETLTRMAEARPFGVSELPDAVRKQFEPRAGSVGPAHFVLAYPIVSMGEAGAVRELARQLRGIALPHGGTLSAAGEPMVLADILEIVTRDAPRILLLTLFLVLGALRVMSGSLRHALLSLLPAVLTLGATAGALAVLGIELNYLNMIMLPILLGIGVDDGMHVVTRVAAGDPLETVWAHTGWDILGAILTDVFGFGVLAFAGHPGLASLGKVATVGLCVNLVACVIFLPGILAVSARAQAWTLRRNRSSPLEL